MFKAKPNVWLNAPTPLVSGQSFDASVTLQCEEAIDVDAVHIEFFAEERWVVRTRNVTRTDSVKMVRQHLTPVAQPTQLPAGQTSFAVRFSVPPGSPASYTGERIGIHWMMQVHVDIPWRIDVRAAFELPVVAAATEVADHRPRVFASSSRGPVGTHPYAEVSIGSTLLVAGQRVCGKAALSNTMRHEYRGITIRLVALERLRGDWGPEGNTKTLRRWTLRFDHQPAENEAFDFSLDIPAHLPPAFATSFISLRWQLRFELHIAWALNARLVVPVDFASPTVAPGSVANVPLDVGSSRLVEVWRQAAQASGFNYTHGEIHRAIGPAWLTIRRAEAPGAGMVLLAIATFPDADLGLRLEDGQVRVRDAEQSALLTERLPPLREVVHCVEASDQRIALSIRDAGVKVAPLARFAEECAAWLAQLWSLREQMPPPREVAAVLPAFRAAARRLGGDLDASSMDIRGSRDEIGFSLELQWDEQTLARTVLSVCPPLPIDGRWHQRWDGRDATGPLPQGLEPLLHGATGLIIERDAIHVAFLPCTDDPAPHVDRLEGMLEVARRLSGHGAGYR